MQPRIGAPFDMSCGCTVVCLLFIFVADLLLIMLYIRKFPRDTVHCLSHMGHSDAAICVFFYIHNVYCIFIYFLFNFIILFMVVFQCLLLFWHTVSPWLGMSCVAAVLIAQWETIKWIELTLTLFNSVNTCCYVLLTFYYLLFTSLWQFCVACDPGSVSLKLPPTDLSGDDMITLFMSSCSNI